MSGYEETSCDHGKFTVDYYLGDGDLCSDGCPVCALEKKYDTLINLMKEKAKECRRMSDKNMKEAEEYQEEYLETHNLIFKDLYEDFMIYSHGYNNERIVIENLLWKIGEKVEEI